MASAAEVAAMRRAIALSAAGLGTTSPNPPVGCVLLDPQDRIIGEGYHERKGEAHAEVQALAAADPFAAGATAVVTLEPCNHQGRTPPCRQSLIDAGIRRAVIAIIDPTSRGEGGVVELRRAGVDVETGVLAAEAQVVLGDWLAGLQNRRPVITWPYLITGQGLEPLPPDTAEARLLCLNADAVLRADGAVSEAVPGSHGNGILALKDQPPGTSAAEAAAALYDGGVRRLLLDGGLSATAPFLDSGLVDRVVAYLPHGNASQRPPAELPWPLLPPGFVITGAVRTGSFVQVDGLSDATLDVRVPTCEATLDLGRRGLVLQRYAAQLNARARPWIWGRPNLKAVLPPPLCIHRLRNVALVRSCELGEPRQSSIFFKPNLRTDDRSEGSEPIGAGSRQMLAIELPEPFFPAELVKLGRDDHGGALVGGPSELGVELQRGGTLRVAQAPGDGVQVGARGQELGGGVVPKLLQRAGDADPASVAAIPVRHRVGVPRRVACRVGGERERVVRYLDAEGLGFGAAALESLAEQLASQQVQGQDAALAVLGRLLDPVALLDDVVGGDPDLLSSEVEPVLAQRADFAAPGSGRDRGP